MKLIIQIPCFNEEKTLTETFNDLPKSITGVDEIEYLIINDGSTDNTVEIAKQIGVHHVVSFKQNSGLAAVFMAGLDACLRLGADIIVNTDADNQYCGEDIENLLKPILDGKYDIVVGSRPIDDIEHFSKRKKLFQHLGSWVVRKVSNTDIPDSPSGFRAFSREAAMKLNVINQYTYTLETIIQAGQTRIPITSVPIRTNPETRESRLFKSMFGYMKRSSSTIIRSFLMYKPLKFFCFIGAILFAAGFIIAARFSILFFMGYGRGHIQSLILSTALMLVGFEAIINGFQADLAAANRKLLEDIQYRVRKLDYDSDLKNKDKKSDEDK
jgi:glycosyltransferase involved in cell wall biosynthesis